MHKNNTLIRGLGVTLIIFVSIFISCTSTKVAQTSKIVTPGDEQTDPASIENMQNPVITADIPPAAADESEFYRLNIFREGYYSELKSEKNNISQHTLKAVFLVNNGIEWFLQLGDYSSFNEAVKEKDILNSLGWLDIRILRYRGAISGAAVSPKPETVRQEQAAKFVYTVQVIATKNKKEAEMLQRNLKMLDIDNTIMINEDNLWKLQVGDYSNYNTAAQMLRQIREMGFSDSWITRRQIK